MSYIGNTPAENYASFLTETFSVSATVNYTLSHAISNENDIRLVINGVIQQPGSGKAYTASGTTLTLTSATVSGDSMYAVYLGRALQTVNPPNASVGSSQVSANLITGQTALTSEPATTDELLISDAGTLKRIDYSLIKPTNTPAFEAYLSSDQTFSDASYVKVNFNTEIYDTNSDYDNSSNYRFTPTVAGKYLVYSTLVMYAGGSTYASLGIYKNGSLYKESDADYDNGTEARNVISTSTAIDFNGSSDYVEIYGYLDITSGTPKFNGNQYKPCNFGAFKIIE